ncbi:MAG: hypothetical protein ACI8TV_001206, partial [Porticoccaceae bacterium]
TFPGAILISTIYRLSGKMVAALGFYRPLLMK